MGPGLENKNTASIRHCRNSDYSPLDVACDCARLEERVVAECWPQIGSHNSNQDGLDKQVSTNGFERSYSLPGLCQTLPDTQRNSIKLQPSSVTMTATLHRFEKDLPDTQLNVLDNEDTLISPAGSQLSQTQKRASQGMHINEGSVDYQPQFLPGSPTQVLEVEQHLGTTKVGLVHQLADNQQAEFSNTRMEILADDNPEVYLPDTQPNSPQWMLFVPSTTTLPLDQSSLLSDTERNNHIVEVTEQTASPHVQFNLTQSNTILADTQFSLADDPELPNLADIAFLKSGTDSESVQSQPKVPHNKINCRERKRIIISSSRPHALTKAMCKWVDKTNYLLDPFREDDECWFHPSPPPAQVSTNGIARACGKFQKRFDWKDRQGKHSLVLNFGIACKLVNYKMTKQQKDGFINKQWHLSHICGNWTCLNPAHTTVEPGNVNISRNNCFSHRSGCLHNPPCMKDKKVPLGADGKLVDHTASMASNFVPIDADDWDDWSAQGFDDGDDSIMIDDNVGPELKNSGDSLITIDEVEEEL